MPAMRFSAYATCIVLSGLLAANGFAADDAMTSDKPEQIIEKTPGQSPEQAKEASLGPLAPQDAQLDILFARLKTERSPELARAIADQIRDSFRVSGSATVDMLMANSTKAISEKRYGAALDFVDQVTLLAPDYAEGWNQRATIHYLMGNHGKSMADTAHTLALEPRHLGALSGLAGILEDNGRDAQALKALESYLSYYPADRDAQKEALEIINKLTGQKT
ncbi:MAG: hypothetical protein JWM58_2365 [Rhizobium sp.]|nr:hypothetical protein [Rhizobium sp.]